MQATIPSGNKFAPDGQCTAAALHAMVDNATLSNLGSGDFSATARPIIKDGTEPGAPITGQLWFISNYTGSGSNPAGVLSVFDGVHFRPYGEGLYARNNSFSTTINPGEVVLAFNNENASEAQVVTDPVGPAVTGDTRAIGVAAQTIAPREFGIIITKGQAYMAYLDATSVMYGAVKMDAAASPLGAIGSSVSVTAGCFGRVMDVTNKIVYITGMMKVS